MAKEYKCPKCGHINEIPEQSWDEKFNDGLGKSLLKATAVGLAAVFTGGWGGLILGGIFYGKNVAKYFDGETLECGECSHRFKI